MAEKEVVRNIGIKGVEAPAERCSDCSCPFHGKISIRGRIFEGKVLSVKPSKTAVVVWERRIYVPKYERFEARKSRVYAHAPPCLHIKTNNTVVIGECRPISKTKKFIVLKKVEAKK